MINWIPLNREEQIKEISELSYQQPCIIYKHSTRCSVSRIAQHRLEQNWAFQSDEIMTYFLDVIAQRPLSRSVAEHFSVYHESPQVLFIRQGECVYEASHLEISVDELKESFISAF